MHAKVAVNEHEVFVLSYSGTGVKLRPTKKTVAGKVVAYCFLSWSNEMHRLPGMTAVLPATSHRVANANDFVAVMFTYEPPPPPQLRANNEIVVIE